MLPGHVVALISITGPLHKRNVLRFLSSMIGTPFWNVKVKDGIPDDCREFKNSVGKTTAWYWTMVVSRDFKMHSFLGNSYNRSRLVLSVVSLCEAKMSCGEWLYNVWEYMPYEIFDRWYHLTKGELLLLHLVDIR